MKKIATFGAGCFWGVERAYNETPGVVDTEVGFMGGDVEDVTYEQVCAGDTGHAEVVKVEYDPEKISYAELLDLFWQIHNPTQLNQQGPDVGSQYRSAIFYYDEEQLDEIAKSKEQLEQSGMFEEPIVTEIEEAGEFYKAEDYHQKYWKTHPGVTCHI